jgi:N-methylhydantoinase A/oxoprolinase/acetone carboxylase beta subunit
MPNIGRIGLLERENAPIMNACLRDLSSEVVAAFRIALAEIGLACPFYLTQNDGTLMDVASAERFPVLTIASGPTNSMRGAAFLSGVKDALVIDIGGTTSDVGALHRGFPRRTSVTVKVGGVRTNFRMPDILSIGLGGGSLVCREGDAIKVGPRSVGYELVREALIFGGATLTASDIAVAARIAELGDPAKVASLDRSLVEDTIAAIAGNARPRGRADAALARAPAGGRSRRRQHPGRQRNRCLRGNEAAALRRGQRGRGRDRPGERRGRPDLCLGRGRPGGDALGDAKAQAIELAVAAGALRESVQVVDVEDVPLAYLPGNATRIRVKAVGDLRV